MRELDLAAARAARAEKRAADGWQPPRLRLDDDHVWDLPPELPIEYSLRIIEGDVLGALTQLVGGDGAGTLLRDSALSSDDWLEILTGIPKLYGFADEGESEASPQPSSNGGKRSRPTSRPTTASTSAKP